MLEGKEPQENKDHQGEMAPQVDQVKTGDRAHQVNTVDQEMQEKQAGPDQTVAPDLTVVQVQKVSQEEEESKDKQEETDLQADQERRVLQGNVESM